MEEGDFENLLIIRETGWENTFGNKKRLRDVATSIQAGIEDKGVGFDTINSIAQRVGADLFEEKLLMISRIHSGPYTIIEGNHRAVAFQLKTHETGGNNHFPKEVYIGVSSNMHISPWLNFEI